MISDHSFNPKIAVLGVNNRNPRIWICGQILNFSFLMDPEDFNFGLNESSDPIIWYVIVLKNWITHGCYVKDRL